MKNVISGIWIFGCLLLTAPVVSQNNDQFLSFEEYLAYVKEHHPLMKQANLALSIGEANLLRARGGFDPKIEVDYGTKKFKNTEYYNLLNTTFKIPTWYGVEFKANFENNSGQYLNANQKIPDEGLYSAGISLSLAQGLLTNERMASLKQAKFFLQQSKADRDLLVNTILYEASLAYFEWIEANNEQEIYFNFLENARTRVNAVIRSVEEGDKAAIDITEARISLRNRELELEMANLKLRKASLRVSNYIWLNNIPLELEDDVEPVMPGINVLENVLILDGITNLDEISMEHPKLQSLMAKRNGLIVDRNFKRNKLLPKIDVQYNFLSEEYDQVNNFNLDNYKAYLNISFPIFLRKERGDLKLANYKLQDIDYTFASEKLAISNKISAIKVEIISLTTQNTLIDEIVEDYNALVIAEERKFFLGESSLFLINSREQKLIDAKIKQNALLIKQLNATASLYNALGNTAVKLN